MVELLEVEPLTMASQVPLPKPRDVISSCEDDERSLSQNVSHPEDSSEMTLALNGRPPEKVDLRIMDPLLGPSPPENSVNSNEYPNGSEKTLCNSPEFHVPLPLTSYARNIYTETLAQHSSLLHTSISDRKASDRKLKKIESMLNNLQELCDYQDPMQNDISPHSYDFSIYEAKYAENTSTKCMFVAEILSSLREHEKHILVLVRPGRLVEILETIFKTHDFVYSRTDVSTNFVGNIEKSKMRVTLAPTNCEINNIRPADIVIAFDSSFIQTLDSEQHRKKFEINISPGIILHLVITYSAEHLMKNLEVTADQLNDKERILELLLSIKSKIGTLPQGYLGPSDAAQAVAQYILCERVQKTWPLIPLPDIDGISEDTQNEQVHGPSCQTRGMSEIPDDSLSVSASRKRFYGSDDLPERSVSFKRHKTISSLDNHDRKREPSPEIDIKQVKDSMLGKSCSPTIKNHKTGIDENSSNYDGEAFLNPVIKLESSLSLQKKICTLENQLTLKENSEKELRHINEELELRCRDFESSLRTIQPRFQEALNDRGRFEYEKDLVNSRETKLREKLVATESTLSQVQEEKSKIDEELYTIRLKISNSIIPGEAELEKRRVEVLTLQVENEKLRKQNQVIQSDFDYMQSNYQAASTSAASAVKELAVLNNEVEKLKAKANENTVKIHQMHIDSTINEYQSIIKGLRAEKLELERQLEKISGQYSALINGRLATRNNSVPRSPHLGASGPSPRPIGRLMGNYDGNG